jgi:hypothetical protein
VPSIDLPAPRGFGHSTNGPAWSFDRAQEAITKWRVVSWDNPLCWSSQHGPAGARNRARSNESTILALSSKGNKATCSGRLVA